MGQKRPRRIQRDKYEPLIEEAPLLPQNVDRRWWHQIAPPEPPSPLMGVSWTVSTYALYIEALRAADMRFDMERDRRYAEVNVEKEKALKIKETADLAALGLAREIQTYKDEKANELREQINNERGLYATKGDLQAAVEKIEATIKPMLEYIATDRGKTRATDPVAAKAIADIQNLALASATGAGKGAGVDATQKLISWGLAIVLALVSLYQFTKGNTAPAPPQIIVVPAGTQIPSAVQSGTPTQTPR